jgi:DNA-directed RNA polymerase subunit B
MEEVLGGVSVPKDRECLTLLTAFLTEFGVAHHQITSYNEFVLKDIANLNDVIIDPIVLSENGNGKTLHFRFGNVKYRRSMLTEDDGRKVPLFPKLAKIRGETYGASVHVDVHIFTTDNPNIKITQKQFNQGIARRSQPESMIIDDEDEDDIRNTKGCEEIQLAEGVTHKVYPFVQFTQLPVMMGSVLCRLNGLPNERLIELGEAIYEPGGIMILRGKERVIIPQKNLGKNMLFINRDDDGTIIGTLHACVESVDVPRTVNKISIGFDKEVHDTVVRFYLNQIYAPKGAPISIILGLLGMTDWKMVISTIASLAEVDEENISKLLRSSEMERPGISSNSDDVYERCWQWLGDHVSQKQKLKTTDPLPDVSHSPEPLKRMAAQEVVHHFVLPHIRDGLPCYQKSSDFYSLCRVKAFTLCHMIAQIIRVHLDIDDETNRDRMKFKRYETPGMLLHKLFKSLLRQQLSEFRTQLSQMDKNNKPIDIIAAMTSDRLQKQLASAIQTGKFQLSKRGGRNAGTVAVGVTQSVTRNNPTALISHLRKTAAQGTRKIPASARQLDASSFGFQCTAETPEGQPCGIQNHLAMLGYCSMESTSKEIFDWIKRYFSSVAHPVYTSSFNVKDWRICVNGRISFTIPESSVQKFIETFKESRAIEEISRDVSISKNPNNTREIEIFCDGGRLIRPLIVTENGRMRLTQDDIELLKSGGKGVRDPSLLEMFRMRKFEMIDGAEIEDTYVATFFSDITPEHTHCEVCPLSVLGIAASSSPYADCNQSPRVVYSAGMCKQAMGIPSFPIAGHQRTTDHILESTEHPMVSTIIQRVDNLPFKWMPTGQNCIVCVMADADNVEDSIIMNENFVQSSGLSSFTDRTYIQSAQRNHHHTNMETEIFENPDPESTSQYKTEARYVPFFTIRSPF